MNAEQLEATTKALEAIEAKQALRKMKVEKLMECLDQLEQIDAIQKDDKTLSFDTKWKLLDAVQAVKAAIYHQF